MTYKPHPTSNEILLLGYENGKLSVMFRESLDDIPETIDHINVPLDIYCDFLRSKNPIEYYEQNIEHKYKQV